MRITLLQFTAAITLLSVLFGVWLYYLSHYHSKR